MSPHDEGNSDGGMGVVCWAGAVAMVVLALWPGVLEAHDWYTGQQSHKGYSCCSGNAQTGDCKPVRAWQNEDGDWVGVYDGVEYVVPPEAIKPDETNGEPFQASMCVYHGEVLCFWRKGIGG